MSIRALIIISSSLAVSPILSAAVSLSTDASNTLPVDTEGPASEALNAFRAGNHTKAVELAEPLAKDGNADALYLMGYAHETGQGAEASRDKALDYYRSASTKGQLDASYRMSFILLASEDESEREQARKTLEDAAASDVSVAGRILGEAYLLGRLTPTPDRDKAVFWWQKAADDGDILSILLLARFYDGQFGFPELKDTNLAIKTYTQAADLGNPTAMVALGSRLLNGENDVRDEKLAREWLKKAIDANEYSAYLVLGDYEENTKKDMEAAFKQYERGKDAGQVDCMLRSAAFHMQGLGTEKDIDRGVNILQQAAKAGSPVAHFQIAVHLLKLEEPDLLGGYSNLLAAATGNLVEAQNELGLFYLAGRLNAPDPSAGVAWLTTAARNGNAAAQNNLATLYENGMAGLARNYDNAGQLYTLAANQGHGAATLALARMHRDGLGTEVDPVKAWALASMAEERNAEDANEMARKIGVKLTEEQRTAATKLLKELKAGKGFSIQESDKE